MSKDKPKFAREAALAIAGDLMDQLRPHCEKIEVWGSILRGRPMVGDIEIGYIPRFAEEPIDLFDMGQVNQTDKVLDQLLAAGVIGKRRNAKGLVKWGDKNKLAVHWASGIPVDFFSTSAECWVNYRVCRTGPAESNARIAMAAQERGWKWNPYGPGFSRVPEGQALAAVHVCQTERDVFEFVGLPYLPPEARA
jgi:DNA polymerase/3'-5' exonuclease PolX